jgi:predicted histidine transporter YuiF (NhaC family)
MGEKIKKIWNLFDEQHEVMAWIVLVLAVAGRWTEMLDQWPTVAMCCTSLVTMLGSKYYAGLKVSPQGIEVDRGTP